MREYVYLDGPRMSVKATTLRWLVVWRCCVARCWAARPRTMYGRRRHRLCQNVNELDTKTAADHRAIGDTDARAQAGIAGAMTAAGNADQHAMAAERRRTRLARLRRVR